MLAMINKGQFKAVFVKNKPCLLWARQFNVRFYKI